MTRRAVQPARSTLPATLAALGATVLLFAGAGVGGCDEPAPQVSAQPGAQPVTQPATRPATATATQPADEPQGPLADYIDLLRLEQPQFPATRPASTPLALEESARLVIYAPLLLDAVGCLWFVHERGQSPEALIAGGELARQTFVVNEPVVFTWWKAGHDGKPTVEMILQRSDGGFDWLHAMGRAPIPQPPAPHAFDWSGAFVFYDSLVVPTDGGVAVLAPVDRPDPVQYFRRYGRREAERRPDAAGTVRLEHIALAQPRSADDPIGPLPQTQIRLDGRGLIAWVPWTSKRRTGGTIGRYLAGAWSPLTGEGWSERPVVLMPMTDGSVLQLALAESGDAELTAVPLNAVPVDRDAVAELVADLSSREPQAREAAFVALANYGPGAWPMLEALLPEQPPIVQKQLEILLGDKIRPTFGGLTPEPGPVEVREWLADGGVVLRFRNGILLPDEMGVTILERPAWVLVRPGKRTGLLPQMLATEVSADPETRLFVWADEWIVCRPGEPPKRWLLNHFEPILDAPNAEWQKFVGIDQAGRWIFRRAGEPATTHLGGAQSPTFVLDSRLPDPSPRLPTWFIETGIGGTAGWDDERWPVAELGGAWRLLALDWEPLPEDAVVHTDAPPPLADGVLAQAPDGTVYRGGVTDLQVTAPDGRAHTWPLPPEAVGSGRPKAVVDREGRLFLFNRPGRVVRIAPAPTGGPEPFVIEAYFEEELPGSVPDHVWLDQAGRICATYFGTSVAVMWPDGQVPASIRQKMPSKRRGTGGGDELRGI